MSLQLLSLTDVKQCITMSQAIDAMERAFLQLASKQVKLPLRTALTVDEEEAITLTMPAYLTQDKALGLEVVSVFPHNTAHNKPSINGFILLLDATTGEPKVLMDAGFLTALRTGAVSGLATRYFSRDDAHHVAIIGSGTQAMTQLEAVATVRDIKRVSVWSRNYKNAQDFAKKLENIYDIQPHQTIVQAVKDADIICTATNSTEPLIHLQDIQPHAHINAIGSHTSNMREIANDVLANAIVIADQREAVLAEAGEIINAIALNQLERESIIEIGEWLTHKNVDYTNCLTVFKSVGLAIQDISVAEMVYQNALSANKGTRFSIN